MKKLFILFLFCYGVSFGATFCRSLPQYYFAVYGRSIDSSMLRPYGEPMSFTCGPLHNSGHFRSVKVTPYSYASFDGSSSSVNFHHYNFSIFYLICVEEYLSANPDDRSFVYDDVIENSAISRYSIYTPSYDVAYEEFLSRYSSYFYGSDSFVETGRLGDSRFCGTSSNEVCDIYDTVKICTQYVYSANAVNFRDWIKKTYQYDDGSWVILNSDGTGQINVRHEGFWGSMKLDHGVQSEVVFTDWWGNEIMNPNQEGHIAYSPDYPQECIDAVNCPKFLTHKSCDAFCKSYGGTRYNWGYACTCNDFIRGYSEDYVDRICSAECKNYEIYLTTYVATYNPLDVNFTSSLEVYFACDCYNRIDGLVDYELFNMCGENQECAANFRYVRDHSDVNLTKDSNISIDNNSTDDNSTNGVGNTGGGGGGGNTVIIDGIGGGDVGGGDFELPPISPPAGGGNTGGNPGGGDSGGGNPGGGDVGGGNTGGGSNGNGKDYSGQLGEIIDHLKNIDDTINTPEPSDIFNPLSDIQATFVDLKSNVLAQYKNAKMFIEGGDGSLSLNTGSGYCEWGFTFRGNYYNLFTPHFREFLLTVRPYLAVIMSICFWLGILRLSLSFLRGV
ncbi:MAG: hypothetical protein LBU73_02160 [Helicobacteraceae bacterium]|jgi:hypothetical protein|nr:hypothetical protein [Helicobacteraceae bacterium]